MLHADIMQDEDGRSKGCGLVKFVTARGAGSSSWQWQRQRQRLASHSRLEALSCSRTATLWAPEQSRAAATWPSQ